MNRLPRILLGIFLSLSAHQTIAQSAADVLKQADELDSRKQYLDALVLVERALEKYPDNVMLLLEQAHLNDARGERLLAFRNTFDIRDKFPRNDTVLTYLGILYEHSGLLDSALTTYKYCLRIARTERDSFNANVNIGSVYNYQQAYPKAIKHYEMMRRQYPDSLSVLTNLAQSYADNGQKDKAVVIMEQIIRADSGYQGAYNNLGLLYTQMGNYSAAGRIYKIAIRREPDDALLLNNYGYLLYRMKDYRNALVNINKSISIYATNPYAYRNRALVYIDMALMKEACTDLAASAELGFKIYYGDEVEQLQAKHCNQRGPK